MPRSQLIAFAALLGAAVLAGGCPPAHKSNEPADLNPNFKMVAEGANQKLSFKADHGGQLYVYDMDSGERIYQGHLSLGEQFVLEPGADRASIDKEPVSLNHLTNTRDNYRLYFLPQ